MRQLLLSPRQTWREARRQRNGAVLTPGCSSAQHSHQTLRPLEEPHLGEEPQAGPHTAAAPPAKRARAAKPAAAGGKKPRSQKGNFVRLNLGKGKGRFAGAGGRKFVNGCAQLVPRVPLTPLTVVTVLLRVRACSATKPKQRTRFNKKGPVMPDSTAAPAPLLVDDDWAPAQPAARVEAVAQMPTGPPPAIQPVAMAADMVAVIEAAQQERSVEHLEGAGRFMLGDSHSHRC